MQLLNFGVANCFDRFYDGIQNKKVSSMTESINENVVAEMTVGEILHNARTTGRRKRELSTISKQLCIREEFLQALEEGDYKKIPELVYILGFARNYAMELGLDPDEIVKKIKQEMGLEVPEQDCDEKRQDDKEVATSCALPEDKESKDIWKDVKVFLRKNWIWLTGTVVALLVAAGVLVFMSADNSANVSEEAAIVATQESVEPALKYNLEIREVFGGENEAEAEVVLQANQQSWVNITDKRGSTVFVRTLLPGDVYYVPKGDGYTAIFGNAGGVDVWVNGKLAPKVGEDNVRKAGISLKPSSLLKGE